MHARSHALATLCALLALLSVSWWHQRHYDFEHDDAYISYRYAANWARGVGPVYNPGETVEGYSNFLFVAWLVVCDRLGWDIAASARATGSACHVLLVLAVFDFARRRLHRSTVAALVSAGAVATHAAVAVWARSGLETVAFALAAFAAMAAFVREVQRDRGHLGSGVACGIAALLRTDGFVFALGTLVFLIIRRSDPRRVATFLLGFAVVFAPYFAWRFGYYGYLFPNAYYLKTGGGVFQQLRGLFYAYNFVEPFGGLLAAALPLVLWVLRDPARDTTRAYLTTVTAVFGAYIVWVGGDHMPVARFFVPLVAPLALLAVEAAQEVAAAFDRARAGAARPVLAGIAACIVAAAILPTFNQRRLPASYAIAHRTLVEHWKRAGRWLHAHAAPGSLLATEAAGAIAYESGLPVIDMLGVNDLHIAHLRVEGMGRGTAGHEKRDFDYVLARRPDLIFRGVRTTPADSGRVVEYADGSVFRLRCTPLGLGPTADNFGVVTTAPLFLCVDERVSEAPAP